MDGPGDVQVTVFKWLFRGRLQSLMGFFHTKSRRHLPVGLLYLTFLLGLAEVGHAWKPTGTDAAIAIFPICCSTGERAVTRGAELESKVIVPGLD